MGPVVVVAAGGQQGLATARQLRSRGIPVRALVRKLDLPVTRTLVDLGCEPLVADFDQPRGLEAAFDGAERAFVYLPLCPSALELQRGRALFEIATRRCVHHLVYSAALGSDQPTGVPHFDSKQELRGILARSGLTWTVLDPGGFMDNLRFPRTWQGLRKGRLVTPFASGVRQPLVAVEDIGRAASACLASPVEHWAGKTVPLYTDVLSSAEQAELLSRALGHPVQARQLPALATRLFLGRDLALMFRHFNRNPTPALPANDHFRALVSAPLGFADWVRQQLDPAGP